MKGIFISFCFICVLAAIRSDEIDALIGSFPGTQKKCLNKYPVSDDVMEKLANGELTEDPVLMNYIYCDMEADGFVLNDGNLNFRRMGAVYARLFGNPPSNNLLDCVSHSVKNDKVATVMNMFRCEKSQLSRDNFIALVAKFGLSKFN